MQLEKTLEAVPEEYHAIYKHNWATIQQNVQLGTYRDTFHYPLLTQSNNEISSKLNKMLSQYMEKIKVNVSFGFILESKETGQLKFFHPSNNTKMFRHPRLLNTPEDIERFREEIDQQDAMEYARSHKPSSKWIVVRIICVRFDVYRF